MRWKLSEYNPMGFAIIEPVLCEMAAMAVNDEKTPTSL
jgi:hypothetical protein